MTQALITFKLIDGENEFHEFEVLQDAEKYEDIEIIANQYGAAEPSDYDEDTYMILDGINCKVHCMEKICDNEVNTLRKFGVIT
tara:strand:- start:8 stop:259 length:252 start_codon:yes stop_codon:yes gene_type:complete